MNMKNYKLFVKENKISYQKELCPHLWEGDSLIERIENKLLRIARDFYENLKLDTEIVDIQLTGSIANYNYSKQSDIDIHILIDFTDINDDVDLVKSAIDGKRFIWNLRHNIVIKGHDVELYVQDVNEPHITSGLYSLMNRKWIKKPIYNPPEVDTEDIEPKYDSRVYDIDELEKISKKDLEPSDAEMYYNKAVELKNKITKSRKDALKKGGEFSIENLVFKKLRNEGKIGKLIDIISTLYDKIYSQ